MESERTSVEELFFKTKDYINIQIELLKLKTIRTGSVVLSSLMVVLVLGALLLIVLLFLSLGLALYLGKILGATFIGFFIVALLYIIVGIIFYSLRKKILYQPISKWIIKTFLE